MSPCIALIDDAARDAGGSVEDRGLCAIADRGKLAEHATAGRFHREQRRTGADDRDVTGHGHRAEDGPAAESRTPERTGEVIGIVGSEGAGPGCAIECEASAAHVQARPVEGARRDAAVATGWWVSPDRNPQ